MTVRALTLACLLGAILPPAAAGAVAADPRKMAQIRAALIYNFIRYCRWPDDAGSGDEEFVIGVVGELDYLEVLRTTMKGKAVGRRAIVVRPFGWRGAGLDPAEVSTCDVLVFGEMAHAELEEVLVHTFGEPVLTIAERSGFVELGGVIELVLRSNKYRFKINRTMSERSDLQVSSSLLRLAEVVEITPERER